MRTSFVALLIIFCSSRHATLLPVLQATTVVSATVAAQESNAQKRSDKILASFNKRKHEVRYVSGVRKEKYKEIRSEPVVRSDLASYSGTYEMQGLGYTIQISPRSGGRVVVTGYEPKGVDVKASRHFHLEDLRLDGPLLSGIKVCDDGAREKFEGLFINMTDIKGVSPTQIEHRVTTFGLGVVGVWFEKGTVTSYKNFYQFKQ